MSFKLIISPNKQLIKQYLLKNISSSYQNIIFNSVDQINDLLCQTTLFDTNINNYVLYDFQAFANLENFNNFYNLLLNIQKSELDFYISIDYKVSTAKKINDFINQSEVIEIKEITNKSISSYINKLLDDKNINVSKLCIEKLVNYLPCDQSIIDNELNKLSYYDQISEDEILEIVNKYPSYYIYELIDNLLSNNKIKLIKILDQLYEFNINPTQIIAYLSTQLTSIIFIKKNLNSTNLSLIAKALNQTPWQISNLSKNIYNYKYSELYDILVSLYELDTNIKLNNWNKYDSLKNWLLLIGAKYNNEKNTA